MKRRFLAGAMSAAMMLSGAMGQAVFAESETVDYSDQQTYPIVDELNFRVRDGNGWTLALISTNCCIATASLQ